MAVGDDSIQSNLVQVRSFELQHFLNSLSIDGFSGFLDFPRSSIRPSEAGLDELLTVLAQQVEGV